MDLPLALLFFLSGVLICILTGQPLSFALALGFVAFLLVGLHRGVPLKSLLIMAGKGARTGFVVLRILILVGLLTALWRASGTIAFFVYVGLSLIKPHIFILIAFLLSAILCLAFGSSFGVCGTAGVVLMAIAQTGETNLLATAGAVLSGAYFGERLSPASSSAALVAAVCKADYRSFLVQMWKTTPIPLALTLLFYGLLSWLYPIQTVDPHFLQALAEGFDLSWLTVLPAVVLVLLPWLHVSAAMSIAISCALAALLAIFVQGTDVLTLLAACFTGCHVAHPALTQIMSGGGLFSMLNVIVIVFLSCAYSGIFNETGMLDALKQRMTGLSQRLGLFPTLCLTALSTASLLCNQSVTIVMTCELMEQPYHTAGRSPLQMATDLGNSAINLAGIVPWCIACSVPLATIGAPLQALPFAILLYGLPLCCMIGKLRKE